MLARKTWHCQFFEAYVAKTCHLIVAILRALMCDEGPVRTDPIATPIPSPINVAFVVPTSDPKRSRHASASPVSVEATFEVSEAQKRDLLPLTNLTLLIVYTELLNRRLWDASFNSGCRWRQNNNGWCERETTSRRRTLATRHLGEPATDGWNCLAGAAQLANAWAYRTSEIPHVIPPNFEFPLVTRRRLAVCLSVAWKFERATCTYFPRKFETADPSLLGPHTHELAFLAHFFMTLEEQNAFGGWNDGNVEAIRGLYDELMDLEVDLLTSTNVFSLLTDNPQVQTEQRAAALLSRGVVTAACATAIRSIVPFFGNCSAGAPVVPTAGALVCAALLALAVAVNPRAMLVYSPELFRKEFTDAERRSAWGLLHEALHLDKMAVYMASVGCYNDTGWVNYNFIAPENLRVALVMAAAVA